MKTKSLSESEEYLAATTDWAKQLERMEQNSCFVCGVKPEMQVKLAKNLVAYERFVQKIEVFRKSDLAYDVGFEDTLVEMLSDLKNTLEPLCPSST